jgi:hypothetical protein
MQWFGLFLRNTTMSYTVGLLVEPASPDNAVAFEQFKALVSARATHERPHPTFVAVHRELTARFPCLCDLPDDLVDDGVWSDGPLINNFGERQAVIGFVYSAVETVLPFVIQVANNHGITVFDWQTGVVHRPGDFVFTVEGEAEIRNPTVAQVEKSIDRMTPNGGPGFAILETTGGYVQAAGGDGLFTVEWRRSNGTGFRHFVAGKQGDAGTDLLIPTNGFHVTVKKNECLTNNDAKLLFRAFFSGAGWPSDFSWRDVTERFR